MTDDCNRCEEHMSNTLGLAANISYDWPTPQLIDYHLISTLAPINCVIRSIKSTYLNASSVKICISLSWSFCIFSEKLFDIFLLFWQVDVECNTMLFKNNWSWMFFFILSSETRETDEHKQRQGGWGHICQVLCENSWRSLRPDSYLINWADWSWGRSLSSSSSLRCVFSSDYSCLLISSGTCCCFSSRSSQATLTSF